MDTQKKRDQISHELDIDVVFIRSFQPIRFQYGTFLHKLRPIHIHALAGK